MTRENTHHSVRTVKHSSVIFQSLFSWLNGMYISKTWSKKLIEIVDLYIQWDGGGVIYIIFLIILINIYFLYLSGHWYVPAIQSTKWSLYGDWNATEIHLSRHTYRRHSATIKPQCSRLKKFFFCYVLFNQLECIAVFSFTSF